MGSQMKTEVDCLAEPPNQILEVDCSAQHGSQMETEADCSAEHANQVIMEVHCSAQHASQMKMEVDCSAVHANQMKTEVCSREVEETMCWPQSETKWMKDEAHAM